VDSGLQSQLIAIVVALIIVSIIVYRRMLPQPVRTGRTIAITVAIVLLSLFGMMQNPRILGAPLFWVLAPVMLVIGLILGRILMATIHFWYDAPTHQLWMRGGVLYLAIWLAIALMRYGVEYLATGSIAQTRTAALAAPTTLGIIAADMLFISIGLWIARGYILVQKSKLKANTSGTSRTSKER
jgi:hypothetical protein